MVCLIYKHGNFILSCRIKNSVEFLIGITVAHWIVGIQKYKQLRVRSKIRYNFIYIHSKVFVIRDLHKMAFIHFGIYLKHEIRWNYTNDFPSGRSKSLNYIPYSLS